MSDKVKTVAAEFPAPTAFPFPLSPFFPSCPRVLPYSKRGHKGKEKGKGEGESWPRQLIPIFAIYGKKLNPPTKTTEFCLF